MSPATNRKGRSRDNATDPDFDPDQGAQNEYASRAQPRQVELARISKSSRAELRVGIAEVGGRQRLFVRQFEANGARAMCATGKAIVFNPAQIRSIIAALEAAETIAVAAGLLPPRAGAHEIEGNAS